MKMAQLILALPTAISLVALPQTAPKSANQLQKKLRNPQPKLPRQLVDKKIIPASTDAKVKGKIIAKIVA